MGEYIAAIDQGTTGTRCNMFDLEGWPCAAAYREHGRSSRWAAGVFGLIDLLADEGRRAGAVGAEDLCLPNEGAFEGASQ